MKNTKLNSLKETFQEIKTALNEWEKIPTGGPTEAEKIKAQARELLVKISEQIKALGL